MPINYTRDNCLSCVNAAKSIIIGFNRESSAINSLHPTFSISGADEADIVFSAIFGRKFLGYLRTLFLIKFSK
jgi:hypothetical protein